MENQPKPFSRSLMYGVIYGLLSSITLYISYQIEYTKGGFTTIIGFTLASVFILLAINHYKRNNSGRLSIGNALKIGLIIGLVGGIIYAVYVYFHFEMVDTTTMPEQLKVAEEQIKEQSPQMTEEQMNQTLGYSAMFTSPTAQAIIKFIGAMFETFMAALIIGLIKKNDR